MGYHGTGPAAGGAIVGGGLVATGPDSLLWAMIGVALVVGGLVLIRLSMLNRTPGD